MRFARTIALLALLGVGGELAAADTLKWNTAEGYRWAEARRASGGKTGFALLTPDHTGINFTNHLAPDRFLTNQVLLNGSGVALGDVDGDGWCDLYLCALERPNALYRNLGNWRFEEVTAQAGVSCGKQLSTGAGFADVDNDGDIDLLVNGVQAGTRLFINDGQGRFTETTDKAGLRSRAGSVSFAIADIDRDDDLDVYVVNYRSNTLRDDPETKFRLSSVGGKVEVVSVNGRPTTDPDLRGRFTVNPAVGILEHGEADTLYINNGKGEFSAASWTDGRFKDAGGEPLKSAPYDWGLSAMFHDVNGDGAPDLYVCNDFHSEDRFWINDGKGNFRAVEPLALRHTSAFSMGVDFSDIDRDGRDDFFVADMLSRKLNRRKVQVADRRLPPPGTYQTGDRPQQSQNTLFWNRGGGRYSEIAVLAGVHASEWSWGAVFMDVDLDGYEDLLISTGHGNDVQNIDLAKEGAKPRANNNPAAQSHHPLIYPNVAFRNKGNLTFEEVGGSWGFDTSAISHGIASGDLDNDGDLDAVVTTLNAPAHIYENRTQAARALVRVRASEGNRFGIGVRFTVEGGPVELQSDESHAGGRYLSHDDPACMFALGSAASATLRAEWPDGSMLSVKLEPNRIYELQKPLAAGKRGSEPLPRPWFTEMPVLGKRNKAATYNDWERQPLALRSLSEPGPAIVSLDVDQDGWVDLLVGGKRGEPLTLLQNQRTNGFQQRSIGQAVPRGVAAMLALNGGEGAMAMVAFSNHAEASSRGPAIRLVQVPRGGVADVLTNFTATIGALALGDADGDGDQDLFVGGRAAPGKHPEPAPSMLMLNDDGLFVVAEKASRQLKELGLCVGAAWADLNGDNRAELLVACEWGSVRAFAWRNRAFEELTEELGLHAWRGLWQTMLVTDVNGDGRADLVLGNVGENHHLKPFLDGELRAYFADVEGDGIVEALEACRDTGGVWRPIRDLGFLSAGLPALLDAFPSYGRFAEATVDAILPPTKTKSVSINTLSSLVLINQGARFEALVLPKGAQASSLNSVVAADFDGDRHIDLVAGQNFSGVHPADIRLDAGAGVLLKGRGDGSFREIGFTESGINLPGETRSLTLGDFNRDGSADFAAADTDGVVKVYLSNPPAK
ncbi:MAG TPA: VCBS repeat-containing protein [Methylomirabilota bacterium]|nr:VCBS repeat-containing protein [Methylomirabilota bacterium]